MDSRALSQNRTWFRGHCTSCLFLQPYCLICSLNSTAFTPSPFLPLLNPSLPSTTPQIHCLPYAYCEYCLIFSQPAYAQYELVVITSFSKSASTSLKSFILTLYFSKSFLFLTLNSPSPISLSSICLLFAFFSAFLLLILNSFCVTVSAEVQAFPLKALY